MKKFFDWFKAKDEEYKPEPKVKVGDRVMYIDGTYPGEAYVGMSGIVSEVCDSGISIDCGTSILVVNKGCFLQVNGQVVHYV
jgi:hypothetical protein